MLTKKCIKNCLENEISITQRKGYHSRNKCDKSICTQAEGGTVANWISSSQLCKGYTEKYIMFKRNNRMIIESYIDADYAR